MLHISCFQIFGAKRAYHDEVSYRWRSQALKDGRIKTERMGRQKVRNIHREAEQGRVQEKTVKDSC